MAASKTILMMTGENLVPKERMMAQQEIETSRQDVDVMPWFIPAGDDGVVKDCILVAVMEGSEIRSVSLHIAGKGTGEEYR